MTDSLRPPNIAFVAIPAALDAEQELALVEPFIRSQLEFEHGPGSASRLELGAVLPEGAVLMNEDGTIRADPARLGVRILRVHYGPSV